MIWHFDNKIFKRRLGYVADYCPVCRGIRCFAFCEERSQRRVNIIPIGKSKLIRIVKQCTDCYGILPAERTDYALLLQDSDVPMGTLIKETFPRVEQVYNEELKLGVRYRNMPAERQWQYFIRPFLAIAEDFVDRFPKHDYVVSNRAATSGILTLVLFFGFMHLSGRFHQPGLRLGFAIVSMCSLVGGFVFTYSILKFSPHQQVKKNVYPRLATSIADLSPSVEMVERAINELHNRKYWLADFINSAELLSHCSAQMGSGPPK